MFGFARSSDFINPEVTGAVLDAVVRARRRRGFHPAELLASLLRVTSVSLAFAGSGVDVRRAREAVNGFVEGLPRKPWYTLGVSVIEHTHLRRAVAHAEGAGLDELSAPFFAADLLAQPESRELVSLLAPLGFRELAFRRYVAHGDAVDPPLPETGLVRVTFHNDPFTTMQLVVDILQTVFGKSEVDASVVMMRAHSEGSVEIGTMPAEEARAKIAKAVERALAKDAPLRITAVL
jgi:ATP-dependent Clp protease adaptor protein ClpS